MLTSDRDRLRRIVSYGQRLRMRLKRNGKLILRKDKMILGYEHRGLDNGTRNGRSFANGLLRSLEMRSN